jgi:outer membrane receptor for ferrienterochelin and colicins
LFAVGSILAGGEMKKVESLKFKVQSLRIMIFSFAFCVLPALAARPGSFALSCFAEEENRYNLGKIVVTQSRFQEKYSDSTASISVINEKDIKDSGAQQIYQVLQTQPSVEIFQYGSIGTTKTIHTRGASDAQVITLVDGRPTNTPRDGITNFNKIPLNNVERIEILRGPASSIYGANAIGGVINIITKSGKKNGKDEINIRYGSEDTKIVDVLTQGKDGRFDYLFCGGWIRSSGFRENSDYRSRNINSTFVFDVNETNRLKFSTGYWMSQLGTPGQITNEDLDDRQNAVSDYFDMTYNGALWENSSVLFKAYETTDRLEFLESTSPYDIAAHTTKIYGTNFQVSQEWLDKIIATIGVDGQENKINSSSSAKHTYNFKAAYAQTEIKPVKDVNIKSGARIDDYSNFGNRTSPSASFSWWALDSLKFHGLWGESFRAPTFNDLYWPREDWGIWGGVEGNPRLKPETAKSYEAGVTTYLFNSVETDVTYFNNKFKDLIIWQKDASKWYRPSNVNNALIEGFEVNANFQPLKKVTANVNYTYMEAKDTLTSRWLTYRPKNIYKGSLDYALTDRLSLYLTGRYTTKRYDNDTNTVFLKDYFVADGNIAYKLNDFTELSLTVNNVFDKDYQEVYNYPMQGTAVTVGARMTY